MNIENEANRQEKYRENIKRAFNSCLTEKLKKLNISESEFCKKHEIDVDNFHKSRYRKVGNVPLNCLKFIERDLGEKCKDLRCLWIEREKLKSKSSLKIFLDFSDEDICKLANNLEELFSIPNKSIIFNTYLSILNDKGQKQVLESTQYVIKQLFKEEDILDISEEIFKKNNTVIINDWLDGMLKIEENKSYFEKWKPVEERKAIVELFVEQYLNMNELEKEIFLLFNKYKNPKEEDYSKAQLIMLAITVLLRRDFQYQSHF